ncbi:hypothetical protein [Streptomyces sp. NPDC056154]|uniref:hypothetical protein n=1 Tax=unclassified Streptomyces TaxID=2593676 RepID=UPI0035D6BE26
MGPCPSRLATTENLGVDTHADVHVTAALGQLGPRLGRLVVPVTLPAPVPRIRQCGQSLRQSRQCAVLARKGDLIRQTPAD